MFLNLRCPHCGFSIGASLPDNATKEELEMARTCPCGRNMETDTEIQERINRTGIKKKSFYTLIKGEKGPVAVRKEGIEFQYDGITLYAYQKDIIGSQIPGCHIIDPETGLSIQYIICWIDTVKKHISRNAIKGLKANRANGETGYYRKCKIRFQRAERKKAEKEFKE